MTAIKHLLRLLSDAWKKLANLYKRSIIGIALARFAHNDTGTFAASLAFYAFFSLFPFLLLIVSVGSLLLEKFISVEDLIDRVVRSLPLFQDWIRGNLENVLDRRGAIGLVGLISLIWSASGYFNTLVRGINLAWPGIKPRHFVYRRLTAIGMVAGSVLLLILSSISSSVLELLSHFNVPFGGTILIYRTFLWRFLSGYLPYILSFLVFWMIYYITPNVKVRKRAAIIGALPAAVVWNLLNGVFTWYLRSGLVRYEIVYGSLSTIVGLLAWIYLSNFILLLGAYISASAQLVWFSKGLVNKE